MSRSTYSRQTDEQVLVVPRGDLFPSEPLHGLVKVDMKFYEHKALTHGTFMWRSEAEFNPAYKQIIPYLVFNYSDYYFLMQRRPDASEVRLRSKYSLGIGGHIRREDIEGKTFVDWALREFHEEVDYEGLFTIEPLGLLNEEQTAVGQVHTGFVFLLKGDSDEITIRNEHKSGVLVTLEECTRMYDQLEVWSAWVVDYLRSVKK